MFMCVIQNSEHASIVVVTYRVSRIKKPKIASNVIIINNVGLDKKNE